MELNSQMTRRVRIVAICTILNIAGLGYILALSIAEAFDPFLRTPVPWFLLLLALLAPHWVVLHLLESGKQTQGLTWAAAWGIARHLAQSGWSMSLPCPLRGATA